jgi:hypothetical protein
MSAMVIVIRRALLRLVSLAVIPVAVVASDPAQPHAATCAQVRNEIAQLNEQLKQDQSALNQWCANTLSLQCQQQGPGMRERIKILGEEISADRLQLITACQPPPPPPPKGLTVTDVSPDTPYGAAAGGGPASGGRIHTLVLDQSSGNAVLYAASENAGVWKSTDGGRNWSQASTGLRNTHSIWNNHVLALDSGSPQRLLYATDADDGRVRQIVNGVSVQPYAGLYVSTNGAATWRPAELSATPGTIGGLCPGTEGNISSVAFSGGHPLCRDAVRLVYQHESRAWGWTLGCRAGYPIAASERHHRTEQPCEQPVRLHRTSRLSIGESGPDLEQPPHRPRHRKHLLGIVCRTVFRGDA